MKDRVTDYARRVVAGKVVCGELHRLACQRHLDDLKRKDIVWDVEAADDIINFAESLTIIEGFEERPLQLLDCQAFDLGCRFGWKKKNGFRRFRRSYASKARQQGKTMENGIMGTYVGGFSGYQRGKLFTVATKKRQARLAWEEMQKFIEGDPDLSEWFDIKDYKNLIVAQNTKCTIEALSKEAGLDDGFRSLWSSVDEIHQHRDNKIYKALYNGTRSMPETLISMITTRGDKINSFAKEMDDYCINILRGAVQADDFFVDIYTLDKGDDPFDENVWIKANPYTMTVPELVEQLRIDAQTAKDMGGAELKDFLTKCMNIWVENTDDVFIIPEKWKQCGSDRTLEDFEGERCWVGLDLSSGGDLTTIALEFETEGGGAYFYSHSFMPRGRLVEHMETDLAPYDLWEEAGLLTVTGGVGDFKNDYKFIIRHLAELIEKHDLKVQGIAIDPHNADGILADLEEFGVPVVIIKQSAQSLNDATCDIQLLVQSCTFEYDRKNELMSWSFLNAAIVRNSFDEIKVDKKPRQHTKRIDPVDACVDAHTLRIKQRNDEVVDFDEEMTKYLEAMGWNE